MARHIKVAAAQMGPNNEGMSREEIVERMLALLDLAIQDQVELIAYPEMALTTYFPKKIRTDFDQFFENEVPPKALEPLLRRAAQARVAVHVGFCEKADGKYFNTALLTDRDGRLCGTFRKIHLPGTKAADGFAQVYEPYYFAHGDTGYRVFDAAGVRIGIAICQDRRYPESYRALALQGAELILIGYNTPISALALDLNELCLRSGAYANLCFVVGVAKAGVEDGVELIGGQRHHQSARPGDREGGDHGRRADRVADRPRPGASRAQAVELPRPAPAAALWPAAPARHREGDAPMSRCEGRAARRHDRPGRPDRDLHRRLRGGHRHRGRQDRRDRPRGAAAPGRPRDRRPGQVRPARPHRLPPARRSGVRRLEDGAARRRLYRPDDAACRSSPTTRARACPGRRRACARRRARSPSSTSAFTSS